MVAGVAVDHLGPRSLRQLLDAVLTIGAELDLDQALQRIVEAAASLVDARYGALGVLDETGRGLSAFITVGVDLETRQAIGPEPTGLGVLGLLIHDARPLRMPSLAEHPASVGFPPNHPPMTSFLGVPIVTRGEVFGNLYLTDKTTAEAFTDLDEQLVTTLAAAAGIVINNARLYGHVRRRDEALTAIHEMVAAVAAQRVDPAALQLVADRAQQLVRADISTIALPTPDGESVVIDVVAGTSAEGLQGTAFPAEGSMSGEVLRSQEPVVLVDASTDPRTGQPQVGLGRVGPAIFAPLIAYGKAVGSLSVGRVTGSAPFSDAELELVLLFAAQAGVILEVDQSRDQAQRISVLEDQERIARDLHDTVIQRLFATGLSMQAVSRLTDEPAAGRIMSAVDELDTTIRHIRTVIFGLERPVTAPVTGVRGRVLDLCAEAARALGFDPKVGFDGPLDTVVDDVLADDLVAVLREALSNVSRHADARNVAVNIEARDDTVTLVVADDGRGLDVEQPGGLGLANMRTRAARRGGRFELGTSATGGALVTWSASLRRRER